ncbi:MAG TPA: hypothetical protein DCP20_01005 [Coriobacteriia bacterium]|nr:hypothetical protein [Coriobacteriia bacterium]
MNDDDMVSVDRAALLAFYDDPRDDERGMNATAVNAVAGEELGIALLMKYLLDTGVEATLLPGPCTTGKRRGARLDAWIVTPEVLYQGEVKNWSAHSFGGTRFPLDAVESVGHAHRKKIWDEYWDGSTFRDEPAAKVLQRMKPPIPHHCIEPLIAFWVSLHPRGEAIPFFEQPLKDMRFDRVHVFSMSTYLRGLSSDTLDLPLPKTRERLAVLDRIFTCQMNA